MADQGEGGVDANDDFEARSLALDKANQRMELEIKEAKNRKLRDQLERSRKSDFSSGQTSVNSFMSSQNDFSSDLMRSMNDDRSNRQNSSIDARVNAANISRASFDKPIYDGTSSQKDTAKIIDEASSSAASAIKAGGAAVAVAFATVALALGKMQTSREGGAANVASVRESLGSSLQDLGVSAKDSTSLIKDIESGSLNGKVGSAQSIAKSLAIAAGSKVDSGLPGKADINGIMKIIALHNDGKLSSSRVDKALGYNISSIAPDAALTMASLGGSPQESGLGLQASSLESNRANLKYRSEVAHFAQGQQQADISAGLDYAARDSAAGAVTATLADNGVMRTAIAATSSSSVATNQRIAELNELKKISKGVAPRPPSTTDGK
jgi:hypothetical protein